MEFEGLNDSKYLVVGTMLGPAICFPQNTSYYASEFSKFTFSQDRGLYLNIFFQQIS